MSERQIERSSSGPYHYEVMTLENGMRVITLEDHSSRAAAVHLWYHVGSKNESPDRRGFAHMFEHMMFRGTDRVTSEEHFEFIRGTGGDCNAYTSFDQTVYVQEVPADQVEMVLWLESERMAFLKIDPEGFHTERKVVNEEYRQGAAQPYGTLVDRLLPRVFQGGEYSWSPIGNMEELEQATTDELQAFWEKYYVPNNATLIVVGDIQHDEVQDLAEKYFSWIPRYPDPPLLARGSGGPSGPLRIRLKENNGPAPVVMVGYRTVSQGHADAAALEVLAAILGGGESSRIYRRLILEDQCASMAVGSAFHFEKDGLFGAAAVLSPADGLKPFSKNGRVSLAALRDEIDRLSREGPTEEELVKVKNNALRDQVTNQMTVAKKASLLGSASVLEGDLARVNQRLDAIRAMSVESLKKVAQTYFDPQREIEIRIRPGLFRFLWQRLRKKGGSDASAANAPSSNGVQESTSAGSDRPSGKPGLAERRPADLPERPPQKPVRGTYPSLKAVTHTLPNGLPVRIFSLRQIPFVIHRVCSYSGAFTESADRSGAGSLAGQMVTRGTALRSYEQLTKDLETLAVAVRPGIDQDYALATASAVTDQSQAAMEALAEVVQQPTFPEQPYQTLMQQVTTSRTIQESEPSYIAERKLSEALFGDHPYARSPEGELKTLSGIPLGELRNWWEQRFTPKNSVLYVAGDVDPDEVMPEVERLWSGWSGEGFAQPDLPTPPESKDTRILLVDHPGDQCQIRVGQLGILRSHPNYPFTRVLNEVFGGGFNSRLNKHIRVEKGLTYGAGGGLSAGRFAGMFRVSTFSKNQTAGEAVAAILEEVRRLREEAPTAEELAMAKNYLLGGFALERQTPQAMVADDWLIESQGLPENYFPNLLEKIESTTSEDVLRTAVEHVDESKLCVVLVGPASRIRPQLDGIAPVTVVAP